MASNDNPNNEPDQVVKERIVPRRANTDHNDIFRLEQDLNLGRARDLITPLPRTFFELDENLDNLLDANQQWAETIRKQSPNFFRNMAQQQKPKILWIGCSDSRVPAETIVQLGPGEIFVHRNIANQFNHTDLNCLAVLQYAIDHLGVEHVIVCGHYGCGGVGASMDHCQHGLVDNWLLNIKDVYRNNSEKINALPEDKRVDLLVELNVNRQVTNIASTSIIQDAWSQGKKVEVHGWVYEMDTGLLKDLGQRIGEPSELPDSIYKIHYDTTLEKISHALHITDSNE